MHHGSIDQAPLAAPAPKLLAEGEPLRDALFQAAERPPGFDVAYFNKAAIELG